MINDHLRKKKIEESRSGYKFETDLLLSLAAEKEKTRCQLHKKYSIPLLESMVFRLTVKQLC